MYVTFFRSSSYSGWDMCNHGWMLEWYLGRRAPANRKAILGNMVHKALELLARKKLALQNGEKTFSDPEAGGPFSTAGFTPRQAADIGYEVYSQKETHHEWGPADLAKCYLWTDKTLELDGGTWNPLNRTILRPELYFDFKIKQEWARYDYVLPDGRTESGYLGLKGTVDLVTEIDKNTIEYLDWKSGRRLNWATYEVKDYKKLRNDPQLRIYHYALSREFPGKNIVMTIVFINDGGAFPLPFNESDLVKTEKMLKARFDEIRNTEVPKLRIGKHCQQFCYHGMNNYPGSNKTICAHFRDEVLRLGTDKVFQKYTKGVLQNNYGAGGGLSSRGNE